MLTVESMVRPVGNVQEYRAIPRGLPCLKATERSEVTLEVYSGEVYSVEQWEGVNR